VEVCDALVGVRAEQSPRLYDLIVLHNANFSPSIFCRAVLFRALPEQLVCALQCSLGKPRELKVRIVVALHGIAPGLPNMIPRKPAEAGRSQLECVVWWKEASVGMINGAVLGVLIGCVA